MRWQTRGGYNWKVTPKLSVNPFVRHDLKYNEEGRESSLVKGSNYGKERDKNETRVGTTFSYKLDPTVTLVGEIYWQTAQVMSYGVGGGATVAEAITEQERV